MADTLPPNAKIEAVVAGGVLLYDVSHLLPRTREPRRALSRIRRVYVHHSGRLGRPGFAGALASVRYVVRTRGFPCAPYHYWIPHEPLFDGRGQLVILRHAPDDWRTWHTGGRANTHGLGVALQGNTTASALSEAQVECLEALLPWLRERYRDQLLDEWLSWHSESARFGGSGKQACPGRHAEAWLTDYRQLS